MADISERNFEDTIERYLLAFGPDQEVGHQIHEEGTVDGPYQFGGFHKRSSQDYDRSLCVIAEDLLVFVKASQPQQWAKLRQQYKDEAEARFLRRVHKEIDKRGTLHVLRKGVKDVGARFQLYFPKPTTGLNPEVQAKYMANNFSVVRQLGYSEREGSEGNSLDLTLFLNGLPLFTAELKDRLTGQNVHNAIKQYQQDRDPLEPLFKLGRCLAHFAVDDDLIYFTTNLSGDKTRFLPFNRGNNRGAGNPPSYTGFATAYLWEQIWSRDSILNLLQHFIFKVEEERVNTHGRPEKSETVIFPRYHQLDAVRKITAHAKIKGPGQRYLVQHSAGSGKSYSISWLAHQLSRLHDAEDQRIFDSVIVVTDRRVLDQQLQQHVSAFEQVRGLVETIGPNKSSKDLKNALVAGKDIIVTTIQKFPEIVIKVEELSGTRFAVIIDEAHSSQGGETAHQMQQKLAVNTLEEAASLEEAPREDWEDRVEQAAHSRGLLPNVSYFALTATPKAKTLELFGSKTNEGEFEPFHLYSMRQAIEENFILDVLKNYTTYKTYWNLLKRIEEDPRYERSKASYLLRNFVELHEHTIDKKVEIIAEHFSDVVMPQIGGRAKAMIVTRSRLHAVRYKLAVDKYLKDKDYPYKTLVAFSGTVRDPETGKEYTETSMNTASSGKRISESMTADTFKADEYRIMIVAEKFQTGFDQPLLQAMYVDKKLSGLHAVQTLSRLNRIYPQKQGVFVLDFSNEAEDIREAFQPYYDKTLLSQATDPYLLYEYETELREFNLYTDDEIDQFARLYFGTAGTQQGIISLLRSILDRYLMLKDDEGEKFKKLLKDFIRLYSFVSQIITFSDAQLEKLYNFGRYLIRILPLNQDQLPVEINDAIDLSSLRIENTADQIQIGLDRGTISQEPRQGRPEPSKDIDDSEILSLIIKDLNEKYGTEFSDEDIRVIQQVEGELEYIESLRKSVEINTPENARLTFDDTLDSILQRLIDSHFNFYKQITDDQVLGDHLKSLLYERYREKFAS